MKYALLFNTTVTDNELNEETQCDTVQKEKAIIRRFIATSTTKRVHKLKRKIQHIAKEDITSNVKYEKLINNCNQINEILNQISEIYKPQENKNLDATIQSNTDRNDRFIIKKIKTMDINDNITYV